MIAVIVDVEDLGRVVVASLAAGVGVSVIFALAIHGAVRFVDTSRDGRPLESTVYGAMTTICLLACVAALVLGIVGLTLAVWTFGILFPINLTCSVLAWIFGVKGRRKADLGVAGQRGLAQAGYIMGIVGTVIGVLALVAWVLVLALGDHSWDQLDDGPAQALR